MSEPTNVQCGKQVIKDEKMTARPVVEHAQYFKLFYDVGLTQSNLNLAS